MSGTPSNDVLAERIQNEKDETRQFRERLEATLQRIESKQDHTNGRVTKLEAWRMFVLGGFAALSAPWAVKIAQLFTTHH